MRIDRRELIVTAVVAGVAVVLLWDTFVVLPLQWFVTLIHEAGHGVVNMLFGNPVESVTINSGGGGLTRSRVSDPGTFELIAIASAGYLGTAVTGGLLVELCARLRTARVALGGLAVTIAAIGFAWVPWTASVDPQSSAITGTSRGDGRFTIAFCVAAVVVLIGVAVQPVVRVRRIFLLVVAIALSLGAVEDLRQVLDISRRGGLSDAASVAEVTPLPSWFWAGLWLLIGIAVCGLGMWSALMRDREAEKDLTPGSVS